MSKQKSFGAPPQEIEASENLYAASVDQRTLRKTNRVCQFNTSVSQA